VLNVCPSAYYQWLKDPGGRRGREAKELCDRILDIFKESRECYGSRRICRRLRKECIRCSRRRVCKLMRKLGIMPKRRRRFRITTDSRHKFKVYPNLFERNFYVTAPDKAWVSDIAYMDRRRLAVSCQRNRPVFSQGSRLVNEREPEEPDRPGCP